MQYDELNAMIMRRFTQPGDIERTRELVAKVSRHFSLSVNYSTNLLLNRDNISSSFYQSSSPGCAQSKHIWSSGIRCCELELTQLTICVIRRLALTVSDVCLRLVYFQSTSRLVH